MKIKLPEKRYFTISELAKRWECETSDVLHLLETKELPTAEKLAVHDGKRSVFFGYYGYQVNPKRPCAVPQLPDEKVAYCNENARDDQVILILPVAVDFPKTEDDYEFKVFRQFEENLATWQQERPEDFEHVILLQDVLELEARHLAGECSEKPLAATERNTLLKQIGALSLALAEQSKKYKRGEKPNALQIATAAGEIVDALQEANTVGIGASSIRESIRQGIELLTAIQQ